MPIRRNKPRQMPILNTSSLPDLIFTVLFFFMIVTHMRKVTVKVRYRVPQGTELGRLAKKSTLFSLYIGKPIGSKPTDGDAPTLIQLNDKLMSVSQVTDYLVAERSRMSPEEAQQLTVAIKADKDTKMKTITEVKQALRRAGVPHISYSAVKGRSREAASKERGSKR